VLPLPGWVDNKEQPAVGDEEEELDTGQGQEQQQEPDSEPEPLHAPMERLATNDTAPLAAETVRLLTAEVPEESFPALQRLGVAKHCPLVAALVAASPVLQGQSYCDMTPGDKRKALVSVRQQLAETLEESGDEEEQRLATELKGSGPLGAGHLPAIANFLHFNLFVLKSAQHAADEGATTIEATVSIAGTFVARRESLLLHQLCEVQAAEPQMDEKGDTALFEVLQDEKRRRLLSPDDVVTRVRSQSRKVPDCHCLQALCSATGVADTQLGALDSRHYQARAEAKRNILLYQKQMIAKQARSVVLKTFEVGDLVGVQVPQQDRHKCSIRNIPGIVVEIKDSGYRVRYDEQSACRSLLSM
jgi:hypothetical protein